MRNPFRLTILLLLFSSTLLAQQPPAPTEITIFLSPLRPIGDDGKSAWISQAFQQNLLNDLARLQQVRPLPPTNPVTDLESAIKAAKSAGATHLFEGSYQLADPGIRITAQILDLRTNQYIGAAKATGPLRDLFALEDSITDQVKRIALAQVRLQAPPIAPQPALPPLAIRPDGPVQFPWDRDKPFIEEVRRQTLLDAEYEASNYRTTYTYGGYGYYGYGGYYRPWRYYGGYGGLTFFPGGVIRGRAVFFPGGVINVGW
ncbi:MAG TPA: hypothetical protein VGQ99_09435 [Tepidisphaeraceae bacterium]|jgi:TolB-like protein|nr:hypothetical protein [Tepidisphaeraceae bacterium]